jgi:glyoxylase-like metal-dependent hydrolase (beta-lactamase superfamily II)
MSNDLTIKAFTLGEWMTNCYIVAAPSGACWIVDAGFNPRMMLDYVREQSLSPQMIILTHAHVDHIGGLDQIHRAHPEAPILIHRAEREFLTDPMLNLSAVLASEVVAPEPTRLLEAGESLELAGHAFEVRHTPGHSPGGITLYEPSEKVALVGDALFAGGIGRTDFPTADHDTLIQAIKRELLSLPDDTRVLPGHGPATTIGDERATNPFLR